MSQLARIADKFLHEDHWLSIAMHLGISYSACQGLHSEDSPTYKCTGHFLAVAHMWLTRERSTGELPRTGDTMLKAIQKCGFKVDTLKAMLKILMEE